MRAAVLGSPVTHSLSPALHRAAYAALGLDDWAYDAVELSAADLRRFLTDLGPEWAGLSLTMPLKQTVLPLLDEVAPLAVATGAANTVVLSGGRRAGHNTDVDGIVAALASIGVGSVSRSLVLGGGATAASALAALARLGDRCPQVLVRDESRAGAVREAARRLGTDVVVGDLRRAAPLLVEPGVDVVISTTPSGAADELAELLAGDGAGALLDVVYDPWPTRLAQRWPGPVVGGAVMLLHQAAAQVQLMTGRPAPLEAMRAVLPAGLLA